jgi:hypothetical protein
MQMPAFDDDEFSVHRARLLQRGKILELQVQIQARIDELVSKMEAGESSDPAWYDQADILITRKRRQIQWINARLAEFKDRNRNRSSIKAMKEAVLKMARTDLFHRCFFEACKQELCAMAQESMQKKLGAASPKAPKEARNES